MTSPVDICNLALVRLGAKPIASLDDDNKQGRLCNRLYDPMRKSELRSYAWNFARKRASLAADSTAPVFGYANAFILPSDFVRLLPDAEVTDWQIENGRLLTNDGAPLKIIYLYDVTDANRFDDLFIDLLSARLAREMVESLTQSNSKIDQIELTYRRVQANARRINSYENTSRKAPTDEWVSARL